MYDMTCDNISRSVDVLKIIAKVLSFDDDQLIAVGLKVPPIDLIGSFLTTVMGKPAPKPEVKVSFLMIVGSYFLLSLKYALKIILRSPG